MPSHAAIFDDLTVLSDATRSRMLLILERHELTVTELCAEATLANAPSTASARTDFFIYLSLMGKVCLLKVCLSDIRIGG